MPKIATSEFTAYIVGSVNRTKGHGHDYVVAPPGYARRSDGTIYRDGTCPKTSAPEMGSRANAYRFKSHRAAARCASALIYSTILMVD